MRLLWGMMLVAVCGCGSSTSGETHDNGGGTGGSAAGAAGMTAVGGSGQGGKSAGQSGSGAASGGQSAGAAGSAGNGGSSGSSGGESPIEYYSIWGSSKTDIWSGDADGQLSHYDGATWSEPMKIDGLDRVYGLWGSSATDVYAMAGSSLFHFDGKEWKNMDAPNHSLFMQAIHGTSATNVWVAGFNGLALVWNGKEWSDRSRSGTQLEDFDSLSVVSETEAWAVAGFSDTTLYHAPGWVESGSNKGVAVYAVGGEVFFGDCKKNGEAWDCPETPLGLRAYSGSKANDVWAISQSALYHYDGTWKAVAEMKYDAFLNGVWSDGEGAWIVGAGIRDYHPL